MFKVKWSVGIITIISLLCIIFLPAIDSFAARRDSIDESCRKSCTYRDRKAYYLDRPCFNTCVQEAREEAERREAKRLQDEANKAIIELNRTYQYNQRYYPVRR